MAAFVLQNLNVLAQVGADAGWIESLVWWAIVAAVVILVFIFLPIAVVKSLYKRCSSNEILVKWGMFTPKGSTSTTIHGGGTLRDRPLFSSMPT